MTGVTVVADFRSADIALGGQGAPLVPAFHRWAFGHPTEVRAVVNIGGIANITLPGPPGERRRVTTPGPGNTLLDQWCREHLGDAHDVDGNWASGGTGRSTALLAQMQTDQYFGRTPPKSTGTDYFNLAMAASNNCRCSTGSPDPQDIQATLSELTARTIADGIEAAKTAAVCGGGAYSTPT